ncbi:hypothetical protein [Pseudoclavibacter sp. RFBA6]|uniref:hypothetical protein n=1 Tax=Pseudoclavibacter sp. RFBA6 TaxID=2080573 RepID=UPI000CE83BBA|nr:hypothetical protein [Pseudoclavibacter sp. RFBA6]PPG43867.1 hypothetical protein C5C17_00240 [Pseudoclavibacter sp. RFBA6]
MSSSTEQRDGSRLAVTASAVFLGGAVAASAVQSTAGWADALLAGPVVLALILLAATAWVARSRPAAASSRASATYLGVALAASIGITATLALSGLEGGLLVYALPLGSALQLAQLARSLAEGRAGRTVNG